MSAAPAAPAVPKPDDVPDAFARAPGPPHTALAFILAPLVPAALAGAVLTGVEPFGAGSGLSFVGWSMAFAVVGYLSALFIGVPVYLVVPLRSRGVAPAVMLLGGMVAALPWSVAGLLSGEAELLLVAAGAFGLGCVGGVAFALIRGGRPPAGPEEIDP